MEGISSGSEFTVCGIPWDCEPFRHLCQPNKWCTHSELWVLLGAGKAKVKAHEGMPCSSNTKLSWWIYVAWAACTTTKDGFWQHHVWHCTTVSCINKKEYLVILLYSVSLNLSFTKNISNILFLSTSTYVLLYYLFTSYSQYNYI